MERKVWSRAGAVSTASGWSRQVTAQRTLFIIHLNALQVETARCWPSGTRTGQLLRWWAGAWLAGIAGLGLQQSLFAGSQAFGARSCPLCLDNAIHDGGKLLFRAVFENPTRYVDPWAFINASCLCTCITAVHSRSRAGTSSGTMHSLAKDKSPSLFRTIASTDMISYVEIETLTTILIKYEFPNTSPNPAGIGSLPRPVNSYHHTQPTRTGNQAKEQRNPLALTKVAHEVIAHARS
jgi:hypothetical protein